MLLHSYFAIRQAPLCGGVLASFLYFLSVCCTARRPNTGQLHTVNIIGKPDIVNPGHQAWLTLISSALTELFGVITVAFEFIKLFGYLIERPLYCLIT